MSDWVNSNAEDSDWSDNSPYCEIDADTAFDILLDGIASGLDFVTDGYHPCIPRIASYEILEWGTLADEVSTGWQD